MLKLKHLVNASPYLRRLQHKLGPGVVQLVWLVIGASICLHWVACFAAVVGFKEATPSPLIGTWTTRAINNHAEGSLPENANQ